MNPNPIKIIHGTPQEPVLYQYRMTAPNDPDHPGFAWQECTKRAYEDHLRQPLFHNFKIEVRKLYAEPPPPLAMSSDWLPSAENINALPEPLRKYIADLETNADPAGMVRENSILRDTVAALEAQLTEQKQNAWELIADKEALRSREEVNKEYAELYAFIREEEHAEMEGAEWFEPLLFGEDLDKAIRAAIQRWREK